ncbi:hypothetical protein GCM10010326_71800 [Streptomyces xanthochromogenes]|uniref:Uncharacterized protein n=1 Tax=Streptomyces xanthochromogenes TaxID=67384 RepID=A0ABQ3AT26_9ACTN|nr:hypothetical protein GCM10010326_71800 [Streptomyces xanthochromogenes]
MSAVPPVGAPAGFRLPPRHRVPGRSGSDTRSARRPTAFGAVPPPPPPPVPVPVPVTSEHPCTARELAMFRRPSGAPAAAPSAAHGDGTAVVT